MAFEYMMCDNLVHHTVYVFLDGTSQARLFEAAPSATGNVDARQEAMQLAARNSFRVIVWSITGGVLINFVVPMSRTIADIQRRIRQAYHIRRMEQRLLRPFGLFPLPPPAVLGNLFLEWQVHVMQQVVNLTLVRVVPTCEICGSTLNIRRCRRCEVVMYCSHHCQQLH